MSKDIIIEQLRQFKEQRGSFYGIVMLGLFGSVARGEDKEESDIDICIKLQEPDCFNMFSVKEELEHIFEKEVDLVSLSALMRPLFKNNLEKDAIYV